MHTFFVLFLIGTASVWAEAAGPVRVVQPVRFEPGGAGFIARGLHHDFLVTSTGAGVRVNGANVQLRFEGAHPVQLEGMDRLHATSNFLIGNDRSQWRRGVPNFGRVMAHELYTGVDAVYYGHAGELEYDLVVHPGADSRQVRLRFDGAPAALDADGNLQAGLVHKRPVTYQVAGDGTRTAVASRFRRNADGSFGIQVGAYDRSRTLVIDPQLTLSAYLGGSYQDIATAIGHDQKGFIYVGGTTMSSDFQVTSNPYQATWGGSSDVFVTKIDPFAPAGSQVVYTTYVGGSGADQLNAMAVDPGSGIVYLTGSTTSTNFPLGNATQSALSGTSDAFVFALDAAQAGPNALSYGTYLGGAADDSGNGIALDPHGRILITGQTKSTDFPSTGGYQTSLLGPADAFVTVIDPKRSGSAAIVYSTYLGGGGWDAGFGIAAASDGTAWVTGGTFSGDFPTTGTPYRSGYSTGGDVFVSHINPNASGGSSLVYSTYLGGSDTEQGNKVSVNAAGQVIVTGFTLSQDFPVTANAVQAKLGGGSADAGAANAFVAVLNPANSSASTSQLVYSTYLGGTGGDEGYDVTSDAAGNIYVAGLTKSKDFPVTAGAQGSSLPGGPGGFVARLNPARAGLADYSTYLASDGSQTAYGVDVDSKGIIYVAGFTTGPLLEGLGGAARTTSAGNTDAFVLGFDPCSFSVSPVIAQFPAAGGTATVTLAGTPGCSWTAAASGLDWLTISAFTGAGPGSVTLTAAANTTGSARTGSITVAGVAIAVTQGQ